jgi:hypothetical protein
MRSISSFITVTEEGEAIGTLHQFARSLNLTIERLRQVLETDARDCIIYSAGWTPDRLLILDGCGLRALCAVARAG